MALTDAKCRAGQPGAKLQKLTDGGGLQLLVQPSGARLWRWVIYPKRTSDNRLI
jgi:hypothetical protein